MKPLKVGQIVRRKEKAGSKIEYDQLWSVVEVNFVKSKILPLDDYDDETHKVICKSLKPHGLHTGPWKQSNWIVVPTRYLHKFRGLDLSNELGL